MIDCVYSSSKGSRTIQAKSNSGLISRFPSEKYFLGWNWRELRDSPENQIANNDEQSSDKLFRFSGWFLLGKLTPNANQKHHQTTFGPKGKIKEKCKSSRRERQCHRGSSGKWSAYLRNFTRKLIKLLWLTNELDSAQLISKLKLNDYDPMRMFVRPRPDVHSKWLDKKWFGNQTCENAGLFSVLIHSIWE